MTYPKVIDNERKKLIDILKLASKNATEISIATGYWDLKAMHALEESFEKLSRIRILIGREPQIPRRGGVRPELSFPQEDIQIDLAELPPEFEFISTAKSIKEWLQSGKLEVRIYRKTFLHAKTYIFGDFESQNAVGLIGSSNFTYNGITTNTELNEVETDSRVVLFQPQNDLQETGHLAWFESKWNDESTEKWNEKFISIIEQSPLGDVLYSPYETYIKTLHDLYKEELQDEAPTQENENGKTLFDFQAKNINALTRRLRKYGVAMLSDSVGLGKTTTAIGVMKRYLNDDGSKKRVEIICPKSLVSQWEKELSEEGLFGHRPITLQNAAEIERKQELDNIASVSLFIIDESHNLRNSSGIRFEQLLEWIRSNPKAHVLLVTATPINNSLTDITTQILLGTGGNADVMKVTMIDENKQTVQISFYQAVENLKKKINQDLAKNNVIDFQYIKRIMTPIIRAFVVRRTRQGIEREYGSLMIDGKKSSFPKVTPHVIDYEFSKTSIAKLRDVRSQTIDLDSIYDLDPESLAKASEKLEHPYRQISSMNRVKDKTAQESAMYFIFQLILLLGFIPYRWKLYESQYYGKSKQQIREMRLPEEENRKLLQQVGIFGILRTVFLKRMESSVYALEKSLGTYQKKLEFFSKGLSEGKIVSVQDLNALEQIWGEDEFAKESNFVEDHIIADFDNRHFWGKELLEDIEIEIELVQIIQRQLHILSMDDSKISQLVETLQEIEKKKSGEKVLVFSYFADTISYLESALPRLLKRTDMKGMGFVSSATSADSEKLACLFSPKAKKYKLKDNEVELQYLIATDVLSEGQNLQDCGVLINYDLHWNPVRMIQRNGRVNRLGSSFDKVHIYNMKPEKKLDSYLNLLQRLQGKIDLIRNTIGTDTSVLDEPENPIEFADSIKDIYSEDEQKRLEALVQAEQAADFLLAEDDFIYDLLEFHRVNQNNLDYRDMVYNIAKGKWAQQPSSDLKTKRDPLFALVSLELQNGGSSNQFISVDEKNMSIKAIATLQALEWLRTGADDNTRAKDKFMMDRVKIKSLLTEKAIVYQAKPEMGAPIGQERDVLRILYELGYSVEEISWVRNSFKTRNLFYKRDIDQLKRRMLVAKRQGQNYQSILQKLVNLAKNINSQEVETLPEQVTNVTVSLIYGKKDGV